MTVISKKHDILYHHGSVLLLIIELVLREAF